MPRLDLPVAVRLMAPEKQAEYLKHDVEWDPPAAITAAKRWTCKKCGRAVLNYMGNVYGSAIEEECPNA